jgi:hypothetical protein
MNTKTVLYSIALVLLALLYACGSKTSKPAGEQNDTKSEIMKIGKGKFAIKSGIVEYKTQVMGMEAKMITYFDDYGGKEASETIMEMMGMKVRSNTITKDGWIYSFEADKKTGTKTPVSLNKGNIDFENLTEEIMKEMKIEKVGNEDANGKPCIKYSIQNDALQMNGFFWVWKGIAMKTDVSLSTMKMVMDAVSVDENADVPAEKFEIPSDIVFQSL